MAGTVTVTEQTFTSIKMITFAWTTSAGGAADGATTLVYTGELRQVAQIPGSAGNQPTDAYDMTLLDVNGLDVLFALGANISNAAASQKHANDGLGCVAGSALTLHVTNGGNAKSGTTVVYIR